MAKKKELKPEIEEVKFKTVIENSESLENTSNFLLDNDTEEKDSYFKNVVNQLMDNKKPSTKTEYLNVNENFAGVKLEFLAKYGNMPILKEFVNIFETKRISLERKGRKELIMALVEREKEMQREQDSKIRNALMGGVQ